MSLNHSKISKGEQSKSDSMLMTSETLSEEKNPSSSKIPPSPASSHEKTFPSASPSAYSVNSVLKPHKNTKLNSSFSIAVDLHSVGQFRKAWELFQTIPPESKLYGESLGYKAYYLQSDCQIEKDYPLSFQISQKGVALKSSLSCYCLARCFIDGLGTQQSPEYGFSLAFKLGKLDDSFGQYLVGYCYEYGKGAVTKNLSTAAQWYSLSALQGNPRAQCNLGHLYEIGKGVAVRNLQTSMDWYLHSARQGHAQAQCNIGSCFATGSGVPKKSEIKATKWFLKAAKQGHAQAQFNVALSFQNAFGVEKNEEKAVFWLSKAANQGHSSAQYNLGVRYSVGTGIEKNAAVAFQWFLKAANQGHSKAQYNIGLSYKKGIGVEIDNKKAVKYFTKAAQSKLGIAQYYLGVHYETGIGVEKDLIKAVKLFKKSAKNGVLTAQKRLELFE